MSSALLALGSALPAAPPEVLDAVRSLTNAIVASGREKQFPIEHLIHAGMYARTCRLDRGDVITSVLIKIPTIVVVRGDCWMFAGNVWHRVRDYQVIAAYAGRAQVYVCLGATEITMLFATDAETVREAEAQFTDEELQSQRNGEHDLVNITGVR